MGAISKIDGSIQQVAYLIEEWPALSVGSF